jgi:cellulose synthase/poly-beta-1,6-N-acetylglucosamine synthase-like glycosyltransferase/peptidoglycan/xylan/chitin deacetylase (PgdA/CDA1 family)
MDQEQVLRRRIRRPPGHWVLFVLVLLSVFSALLAYGYSRRDIGRSSTAPTHDPSSVPHLDRAGPIVDFSTERPTWIRTPPKTIALTFDDGPDPVWTPRILEVLKRNDVQATFFVLGSHAMAEQQLVRDIVGSGHEIGIHTFTHVDMAAVPAWRQRLELFLSQATLAGIVDVNSSLFRLPYSSTASSLSEEGLQASRNAAGSGYILVFADLDSADWRRPGAGRIVANSTPPDGRGAIVLLHDGGGDRSQTLRAMEILIPELKRRGYRFATVSEVARVPAALANPPASGGEHLRGVLLMWAFRVASSVGTVVTALPLPILALMALRSIWLIVLARRHVKRRRGFEAGPDSTPPASIVIPAYNEAVGIAQALRSLVASDYPRFELIVVDDGSTDGTGDVVRALGIRNLRLLHQPNRGKAQALNAGVGAAMHPLIVTVDGDTVFEPPTLGRLLQPFRDPSVGAVSGNTKVANRRGLIGRWQHIEYVMGFNLDRRAFDVLEAMPTVPGAVGAFRREALEAVGGFSDETLAEDTDVALALNRAGWHVVYQERAVAWTEAPSTWAQLWQQRYRWSYGTLQSFWKHRAALWNSEGHLRRSMPYLLLFTVALPMLSPVMDLYAVYGLIFLDPRDIAGYWLALTLIQLAIATYAFRLDGEGLRPLWALPLQQILFRQLTYLVIIQSVVSAIRGARLRWHKLRRAGVDVPALGSPRQ